MIGSVAAHRSNRRSAIAVGEARTIPGPSVLPIGSVPTPPHRAPRAAADPGQPQTAIGERCGHGWDELEAIVSSVLVTISILRDEDSRHVPRHLPVPIH